MMARGSAHGMAGLGRIAWRNLWRNHRRTIIMLAAIIIGTWGMIFCNAMLKGMMRGMVLDGIDALPGHVQVHHTDYRDDPSVNNSLNEPDGRFLEALNDPRVEAWTQRIKVPAVISSEYDSRAVVLLGIEPEREIALGFDAASIGEGRYLEGAGDSGLLVGRKLLERLDSRLGKRVVLMSQNPDNDIAERGLRIVGVYEAELESTEESLVYTGLLTAQEFLDIPGEVSEIAVRGHDFENPDPLREWIAQAAPADAETLDWRTLNKLLAETQGVTDGIVFIMVFVVFLALSFGLANTFMMAVFERVREIGLMKALGMGPTAIVAQILLESMIMLVIGVAAGNVLAWASLVPLQDGVDVSVYAEAFAQAGISSVLTPALEGADMLFASVTVLILGTLTSLLPALRAARLDPVRAINKI